MNDEKYIESIARIAKQVHDQNALIIATLAPVWRSLPETVRQQLNRNIAGLDLNSGELRSIALDLSSGKTATDQNDPVQNVIFN